MLGKMDCFGLTDVGRRRSINEDQFLIADLSKAMRVHQTSLGLDHQTRLFGNSQGKLLAVADGMGGQAAGERASQLAVDSVVNYILNTLPWFFRLEAANDHDFRDELKASLQHCQSMLQQDAVTTPQRRGMGTTLTMAYIIWPRMYVVHVGDSRCYLKRDGKLKQITRDHTVEQLYRETRDDGENDQDTTPWSNLLWNVIGSTAEEVNPDVYHANLELGDTILLCSDGLTKHLTDATISELLSSEEPTSAICQKLIDAANNDGGTDNITAVVSRFCDANSMMDEAELHADVTGSESNADPLADTGIYPAQATLSEPVAGRTAQSKRKPLPQ